MYIQSTTATAESRADAKTSVLGYTILFKPMIVALVLVATLAGAYIAQRGLPSMEIMFWTLLGTGMATAAAGALNNYVDRDIDSIMKRTRGRTLPAGQMKPSAALAIGVALGLLSAVVLDVFVNPVAATLAVSALLIYVIPYTMWTKRKTPIATFIGGVGGALPPVIGYAAIKPELDVYALTLFLIIFAWQHPHFWSLGLKYRNEYAAAGVRNLCVVAGPEGTKKRIAVWAAILAAVSVLPYFLNMAGVLYLYSATALGLVFLGMALWFLFSPRRVAMSLFFYSIIHLPALYCAMVVDIV